MTIDATYPTAPPRPRRAPRSRKAPAPPIKLLATTDLLNSARRVVEGIRMAIADLSPDERDALAELADIAIERLMRVRDDLDKYRGTLASGGAA